MPMNEHDRRIERAGRRVNELRAWRNAREFPIMNWTLTPSDWHDHPLKLGDSWPVIEIPVKLQGTGAIPKDWAGLPVDLELWLGGEGRITLSTGTSHGLNPYHHLFPVTDAAEGGMPITIDAEVSPKGLFGANVPDPRIERAHLVVPHRTLQALAMDLGLALATCEALGDHEIVPQLIDLVEDTLSVLSPTWPTGSETTINRHLLGYINPLGSGVKTIHGQGNIESADVEPFYADMGDLWSVPEPTGGIEPLPAETLEGIDKAHAFFTTKFERLRSLYPPIGHILLTGHAHIDLAWLWPTHETRRKLRRTFSTVLSLMDRYEDFTFNQSSSQAYAWVEQDDPELFERVKARIKEGRWEAPGGMWLEPDCEVTGGEAMARQILYGQQYIQQRFGLRSKTAWLPDVFGFSGGIPQLLRSGGLDGFYTIKLNWNETNTFPHDLFTWEGIDGSTVTAWMSRNNRSFRGYNADIQPIDMYGSWADFDGKRYFPETLVAFGWGDGGGGPTQMQLDRYARLKDYPVLPRLRMGRIDAYRASLPAEGLPVWTGEMNLELHRGTLTSHGRVKELNRAAETRLVEAEAFGALAAIHAGFDYPIDALSTAWKMTLLNQFHDILPGSSIHEVYEDTHREMDEVVTTAIGIRDDALAAIGVGGNEYLVANASASPRPLLALLPAGVTALQGAILQPVENGTLATSPEQFVPAAGWSPFMRARSNHTGNRNSNPPSAFAARPSQAIDQFGLTQQERRILSGIEQGLTNQDLSEQLFISTRTVAVHVQNILRKLNAETRDEAISLVRSGAVLVPGDLEVASRSESGTNLQPPTLPEDRAARAEQMSGNSVLLSNAFVSIVIGADGTLHQVRDKRANRDVLSDRGNQLWGYLDRPRAWDAWDVDDRYVHEGFEIGDVASVEIIESGPIRAAVRVTRNWRSSTIAQTYQLTYESARLDMVTDIDWNERRVFLRAKFPLNLHAHESTADTIYGVHRRPTHVNTSWQEAHFEKSMQRWVDLSETGYGVAILNDGKYAYSATPSELGISLLRSPIYPDHFADSGEHHFTYSLFPHEGGWADGGVPQEAIALNSPLVATSASSTREAWGLFAQSGVPLTLGSLKRAEEDDALILRLHESGGRRGETTLTFGLPVDAVERVTILEEPDEATSIAQSGQGWRFNVRPFEVVTLRIRTGRGSR